MRMIIDFIKSWLYYPKLKKYLKSIGIREEDMYGTRWGYAKNQCRFRKELKYNRYEPEKENHGWNSVYDREPIEK